MSILVIYATVEGQTGKIARFIEDQLRATGQDVALFDANDRTRPLSFDGVNKVVLAAPVHERRHPEDFELLLSTNKDELAARPTLLLSVSLNAAFPEKLEEARDYITELKMRARLEPDLELPVAGAVRGASYDYYESQVLQHVVLQGQDVDPTAREQEFTDWDQLAAVVTGFATEEAVPG